MKKRMAPSKRSLFTFLFLFIHLLVKPVPSSSISILPILRYRTLLSLSHTLFHRVAALQAARGDAPGAARALSITRTLEHARGLGLWNLVWGNGWYVVVTKQGALKEEIVEGVKREVVEGQLVRDCLEIGGSDFKGLVRFLEDIGSQFSSSPKDL